MGYKGVVKDSMIVLEQGVKLPEGTKVEVIAKGWWLSEEAQRNASDRTSFRKWLAKCDRLRERIGSETGKTTDSVKIIREMREERSNR